MQTECPSYEHEPDCDLIPSYEHEPPEEDIPSVEHEPDDQRLRHVTTSILSADEMLW